eukprot:m.63034 g.63034  ORF g.63034 m.63034 type:complete len:195 (+) comp35128_c0_seq6:74-658(+)
MTSVYLFVPNLIGYARLVLVLLAYVLFHYPIPFLVIYGFSAALDGFDGYAARKYNQMSAFGAWLDVVVDNISRGMVWCQIVSWGFLFVSLEWCVFVCTHTSGSRWREAFDGAPWWVKRVMAKGFKTYVGFVTISGLHVLPLWIYGLQRGLHHGFPAWFYVGGLIFLIVGRLMSLVVEMWCIWMHVLYLSTEKSN